MSKRHTYSFIKQFFEKHGCVLLSQKYKNVHTPLDYICECGKRSKIGFRDFQNGHRCLECGIIKRSQTRKHSFDKVFQYFAKHRCELLSNTYENTHSLLKYRCVCGRRSTISFYDFQNGHRCQSCGAENMMKNRRKTAFHWKKYKMPSGMIVKVQGYEPLALNLLLKEYDEVDIVLQDGQIPVINYIGEDNKPHKYFPDIFIPRDNLIIEVKSKYYYKKELRKNQLKKAATKQAGYDFRFVVFDSQHNLITV